MSQLIIYNWMPWTTTVSYLNQLMGTGIDGNPLPPSTLEGDYYPASTDGITRDLSEDHGTTQWGKTNDLTIHWREKQEPMQFIDIEDPPGAEALTDLLLWVFPDRVVFSQGNLKLTEVYPKIGNKVRDDIQKLVAVSGKSNRQSSEQRHLAKPGEIKMPNVYFANGTSDTIHVDVNGTGVPTTLDPFQAPPRVQRPSVATFSHVLPPLQWKPANSQPVTVRTIIILLASS